MKNGVKGLLSFLLIFVLINSLTIVFTSCAKSPVVEYKEEKEERLSELNFQLPDVCGGCHKTIHSQWENSMHANAFIDPFYLKEVALAGKEAGEEVRNFCHSCHAPAASLVGKIPTDPEKASNIAKKGIFCDFCHSIEKITGVGNALFEAETASSKKRGPYKDSSSPHHLTEYSEIHTKAEFCGSCHDVYHPTNKLPVVQTYTEWKESPYPEKGIVCQDCHMTPGPQITKPNPGVVATGGPKREHYWTHSVVGANTFMSKYLGNHDIANQAVQRLKSAATIEVKDVKKNGNQVALSIKVSNVGAGHKLPTGLTEMRHIWIEITVINSAGKTIYQSGKLNKQGVLPDNTRIFRTVLGDAQGKPTFKFWEAEKILTDNRIAPKKSVTEIYEFSIPSGSKGPYTAKTKLLYRSAYQRVINGLFKDSPEVPVIEMDSTSKAFK